MSLAVLRTIRNGKESNQVINKSLVNDMQSEFQCVFYIHTSFPSKWFEAASVSLYLITHRESLWHKWHTYAGVMLLNHTSEKSTTEMVNTWSGWACRYQKHVCSQWCKRHHCQNIQLQLTIHMGLSIHVQWFKQSLLSALLKSRYDQIMPTQ